jgi:Xaa-Pro aminopeptidase
MSTPFTNRRRKVVRELARRKLDCLLVTHPANWYYLTGFTGESGVLAITQDGSTLITDGRFTVQAKDEAPGVRVVLQKDSLYACAGEWLRQQKMRRAGYDPGQWTVAQGKTLKKACGPKCKTIEAPGIVERLRMKKDPQELAAMRKAALLAGEVLESVLPLVKPGVREADIGAEIEYRMKKRGASGPSFESIVASGKRAALPHARPTSKRLRKNELVVLDLGAILAHYCSLNESGSGTRRYSQRSKRRSARCKPEQPVAMWTRRLATC